MAIPVSSITNVSIAIGASFPARKGFGTLNIVTAEADVIGIAERVRTYSNIAGVTEDWPADSEALAAATAYFGQQPKPSKLKISARFPTAQAAQLRCGAVADNADNLALFTAISDGSASVSIDGASFEALGSMDFSSAADLAAVAATLQTQIQAVSAGGFSSATVTHDDTRFFINSGTTGASSSIAFLTTTGSGTDVSDLLQGQQGQGTKTDGIAAETVSASLTAIEDADSDWYGLVFTREVRDDATINGEDAVEAAAAWCEARVKTFATVSNDEDVLDSVTDTDIFSVLKTSSLRRTLPVYSSKPAQYPDASVLGRAFTVNFNQEGSSITLKFKQLPGITAENMSQNQKAVLDSKNGNTLVTVGGINIFVESTMASGVYYDEVHGLDWLTDAVQTTVFGYVATRTTKVPYTEKGIAAIGQQISRTLDEALRNGLIAPGETIDGKFLPFGYSVTLVAVADTNQSDKESRTYNGGSFVILGAGAIHGLQINGTFER